MDIDLTPYIEGHRARAAKARRLIAERRARIRAALERIAPELARRFGLRRVYFYGSWVWGSPHERSDIDLALEGLHPEQQTTAMLATEQFLTRELPDLRDEEDDVKRFEDLPPYARERILGEAVVLYDDGSPRPRAGTGANRSARSTPSISANSSPPCGP